MFVFISELVSTGVYIHIQYIFDMVRNKLQTVSTRVNQKKIKSRRMSCKCALNFDQCKTFFKNYKPMRVWLWLVYIFTENNCHLQLQVHSNSEEVSNLSWQNKYANLKTTCHIKLKFFLWAKLLKNLLLANYLSQQL